MGYLSACRHLCGPIFFIALYWVTGTCGHVAGSCSETFLNHHFTVCLWLVVVLSVYLRTEAFVALLFVMYAYPVYHVRACVSGRPRVCAYVHDSEGVPDAVCFLELLHEPDLLI